jgi:hypothetical protein
VASSALLAAAPATAVADTHYGGSALRRGALAAPAMSLVVRDDGRVSGRLAMGYDCNGFAATTLIVRVNGRVNGAAVTASGRSRGRGGTVRASLTGTVSADAVTGRVRLRAKGCWRATRSFVLRGPGVPAGAPAGPSRGSVLHGLTAQSAGGIRLPISIRVARNGRMYAYWSALLTCHSGARLPLLNATPTMRVRRDGTFRRTETFTVRFRGSADERYRVSFSGRFLADGAVGTLRARMVWRERGKRYYPCLSGTQSWVARP